MRALQYDMTYTIKYDIIVSLGILITACDFFILGQTFD